jgi:hypothetical protein
MRKLFLSPSAALCALAFTLGPIGFTVSVRAEEDGDRLFRTTCGICHTVQSGQNRLGPSLGQKKSPGVNAATHMRQKLFTPGDFFCLVSSAVRREPSRASTTPMLTRTRTLSGTRLTWTSI